MISPYRVEYATFSSLDFDLICDVAFESDSGATSSFLSREAVASETYRGDRKHVSSYKYTESFAPVITFVDKNFGEFTMERQRQILKWITSKDTPSFLSVYHDDSNVVSYVILGNFISCDSYKLGNGRVVGFQCTFESVMPYALSDLYTVTKTISSPTDNKITIEIDTDDSKPVYPRVTINHGYDPDKTSDIAIPHTVVDITGAKPFTSITDMADYVEDTVYKNGTKYYYKTYKPTFTQAASAPTYAGWTTVIVNSADKILYANNTFYYYDNKYYWKETNGNRTSNTSRPSYGDWAIKDVTRAYTASDNYEDKTIYKYVNGSTTTYYWMAQSNFVASNTEITLPTTSVKLTNTHYDFFNRSTPLPSTIVKHNSSTEVVTIDGANRVVSSSSTKRIYGDDFNWQWLELHDGKNEIEVLGNCEVTLSWREVRKVGSY